MKRAARSRPLLTGLLACLLAVLAVAAALALRWALHGWLGPSLPFVTVFAAIGFAAWYGGTLPALLAALLGFAGAAWLFLGPEWLLAPWGRLQFAAGAAYAISCTVLIGLTAALRRERRRAEAHRGGLEQELAERESAEQSQRAQREQLATTLRSIADGVIATDAEGRVHSLNPGAEALTGWSEREAIGLPLDRICLSVEEGGVSRRNLGPATALRQALTGNAAAGPFDGSLLVARDGTRRPIEHSAAPLRDAHGGRIGAVLVLRDAGVRRRAERELRRAHDTLDAIVRASPLPLVVVDLDPPIVRVWNPAAERLFGWSAEEVIGKPVPLLPPGHEEEGRELRLRVSRARSPVELETQRRCADGSLVTVRIAAMPLRGEAGAVTGVLVLYSDITQRRRAEAALVRSEATLRAFYDNTPVGMGVVELTDDGDILHLYDNPVTCRLFGVPPGGTSNRRASSLGAAPATVARWIAHYQASAQSGRPVGFEYEIASAEGRRWFSATVAAVAPGAAGRTRFCYVSEDITERHRGAERLQESEAAARLALQVARLGTWRWDPVSNTLTADARCREICGLPAEGPLDLQAVGALLHPDDRARTEALLLQALRPDGSGAYADELRLVHPDGSVHWALSRGQMLYSGEGSGRRPSHLLGTVLDITRRKGNEQLLRQADRSKDEFLATLAHELRNPLAPVRNGVHLLRRVTAGLPAAERPLALVERQLGHMVRLVDDLLDVSRVSSAKIELLRRPLPLATAIRHAVEISQPLIDAAGHMLALELPGPELVVDADLTRLSQVIANLLNNAAKYTPPGGRIELAARAEGEGQVLVTVSDNGIGIAREMLPRVFEMFTQGHGGAQRSQGGLGIGLAIARRLAELHGGRLDAESEGEGRGSRFLLRLPRVSAAAAASAPARMADAAKDAAAPAAAHDAMARKRVLVADDNGDAADSLGEIIALMGHDTRIARDGLEAVRLADGFRPEVALLDLGMPGLNGYEVAQHLRAQDWAGALVLIAVTGWGQQEDRRRSAEAGFDRHVVKPVEPGAIEGLLATRRVQG